MLKLGEFKIGMLEILGSKEIGKEAFPEAFEDELEGEMLSIKSGSVSNIVDS